MTWSRGGQQDGSTILVVTAMRRDIVQEYEAVCAAAGLHAGTIDLATFNVVNLALLGGPVGRRTAGRQPAGARHARLRVDRAAARRRADLLPHAPERRHRAGGRRRPPDAHVLRGPAERPGLRAGAARRRPRRRRPRRACRAISARCSTRRSCRCRSTASPRSAIASPASEPLVGQIAAPAGIVLRERTRLMLRGNLSTRPFYNERAVQALLGGLAVVLGAAVAVHGLAVRRPDRAAAASCRRASRATRSRAADLRREAQQVRSRVDRAAARVHGEGDARSQRRDRRAHVLVDGAVQRHRAHHPERGPPASRCRPRNDRGVLLVRLTVNTPRVEPVGLFLDRLEAAGAFAGLRSVEEQVARRRHLQRRVRRAVPRARVGRRAAGATAPPRRRATGAGSAGARGGELTWCRLPASSPTAACSSRCSALLAIANFIGLALVVGPIRSRVHTLTQRATVGVAVGLHRDARTGRGATDDGRQRAGGDRPAAVLHAGPAGQPARRTTGHARAAGAVDARGRTCRTTAAPSPRRSPRRTPC